MTVKIDATPPTVTCQTPPPVSRQTAGRHGLRDVDRRPVRPGGLPRVGPAIVTSAGAQTIDLTGEDKAGNTTTEACAYIVAYKFLGFDEPLPAEHRKAGSTIPGEVHAGGRERRPDLDAEAAALAAACSVRVFFSGGDPSPNCAEYKAGPNRFEFLLRTPKGVTGSHVITIKVFDGAVVINEEDKRSDRHRRRCPRPRRSATSCRVAGPSGYRP